MGSEHSPGASLDFLGFVWVNQVRRHADRAFAPKRAVFARGTMSME